MTNEALWSLRTGFNHFGQDFDSKIGQTVFQTNSKYKQKNNIYFKSPHLFLLKKQHQQFYKHKTKKKLY